MTTFLLVRHASHDLLERAVTGWAPGVHLNGQGQHEAEALAAHLALDPPRAVYSSPLDRCVETSRHIADRCGCAFEIRESLGEIHFGEWTGRSFAALDPLPEWRVWNEHRTTARSPGGESILEVQARIVTDLERLRVRHPGECVAVVSHGDVIKAAIAFVLGSNLDLMARFEIAPASISMVRWDSGEPTLVALNRTHAETFHPAR